MGPRRLECKLDTPHIDCRARPQCGLHQGPLNGAMVEGVSLISFALMIWTLAFALELNTHLGGGRDNCAVKEYVVEKRKGKPHMFSSWLRSPPCTFSARKKRSLKLPTGFG